METQLRVSDALFGAALLVGVECLATIVGARAEFAGAWEIRDALFRLAPLSWTVLIPASLLGVAILTAPRRLTALSGGMFGAALAASVSQGRHFAAFPLRAAFVLLLAVGGGAAAYALAPWVTERAREFPRRTALLAVGAAVALELSNRWVLVRLYPGFHLGLTFLTGMLAPFVALAARPAEVSRRETMVRLGVAVALVLLVGLGSMRSAGRVALDDNLRLVFLDRSPLMSLGVQAAVRLVPPAPLEPVALAETPADVARHVDFRGRDIVLVSIDALRADHVGAYGYARPTTPNIDALAASGVRFAHAYCPTPHTSYSVTSMMTGKNLRPLLLQGLGADSDTWAGLLRTYGYKTAAFYPPAVFFIDQDRFTELRDRRLDFEYARIEFADPHERARAVEKYLDQRQPDERLFLWVHLFEPHEPYVAHPEYPFGDRDIDRYDSEIALADEGVGEVVKSVRSRRPRAVVVVTADHGEEFGDHDGHYHGTTVYEEQVRVPLVVSVPGLPGGRIIDAPVQTIDLLPTMLAALDVPRPARLRGNNLGRWLEGTAGSAPGQAFAETDDQMLLAEGSFRLICARRAAACALFDIAQDPEERHDVAAANGERFSTMKGELRAIEDSHGRFESAARAAEGGWPSAIRRGMSGDAEAAPEVAGLLEDTDVAFRRKAAEVLFDLDRKEVVPQLRLAAERDDDDEVRRFSLLALVRLGEGLSRGIELLDDHALRVRRFAALALAENGDPRGAPVLVAWWQTDPPPFARAREIVAALGVAKAKDAVPALVRSLDDVRLRPFVAAALGAIGHPSARGPLAERWGGERYQNARAAMGEALVRLGAHRELVLPLVRFLGTPNPLPNGLELAAKGGVLSEIGGPAEADLAELRAPGGEAITLRVRVPLGGNGRGGRVLVRARTTDNLPGQVRVEVDKEEGGVEAQGSSVTDPVTLAVPAGPVAQYAGPLAVRAGAQVRLKVQRSANVVVEALSVVPLSDELPPPPPDPWTPPTMQAD